MTEAQANKVMEILDINCIDYDLREDYSGRCMYGRTTRGIVCNLGPAEFKELMEEAFVEVLIEDDDILCECEEDVKAMDKDERHELIYYNELFPPLLCDNMGKRIIHY